MGEITQKTVRSLAEQLHICLSKAINTAMTHHYGENWFADFKTAELSEGTKININRCSNIDEMDFQACLKFLRFRVERSNLVFTYYNKQLNLGSATDNNPERRNLEKLLRDLMEGVRNKVIAHSSVTMATAGKETSSGSSVYKLKNAAYDLLRLAEFFKEIRNEDGVSYYDKMVELSNPLEPFSIAAAIQKETLRISEGDFAESCKKNNIPTMSDKNGKLYFLSRDYKSDIATLKNYIQTHYIILSTYDIAKVIQHERLDATVEEFKDACLKNNIRLTADPRGNLLFSTANYPADIARIKLSLSERKPKKKTFWWFLCFGIAIVVLMIVIFILIGRINDSYGTTGDIMPSDDRSSTSPSLSEELPDPTQESKDPTPSESENEPEPSKSEADSTPSESETDPTPSESEKDTTNDGITDFENLRIVGEETVGDLTISIDQMYDDRIVLNVSAGKTGYFFKWGDLETRFIVETVSGDMVYVKAINCNLSDSEHGDWILELFHHDSGTITLSLSDITEPIKAIRCERIYPVSDTYGSPYTPNVFDMIIEIEYTDP